MGKDGRGWRRAFCGGFWTFLDAQARHRLLALQIVLCISSCDYDRPAHLMQVTLRLLQSLITSTLRYTLSDAMSDLQRSFAKAKLAGLPFEPPLPPMHVEDDEGEEEMDDLKPLPDPTQDDDSSSASSASSASSTGTIRPSPSKHLFARPKGFVKSTTFHYRHILSCLPCVNMLSILSYFVHRCLAQSLILEKKAPI